MSEFFADDRRVHDVQPVMDAAHAVGAARRAQHEVEDLRRTIGRMRLTMAAMWELLGTATGMSEDDLRAAILRVQERVGRADGRIDAPPAPCPACERPNKAARETCAYCGLELGPASPF